MEVCHDFSTNRHARRNSKIWADGGHRAKRHPTLNFEDGNLAILAGEFYFLVHQGLISRHSAPLAAAILELSTDRLEGRPVLRVSESSEDMLHFLTALYDGVSSLGYDNAGFPLVAIVLTLATKYDVKHLRNDLLRGLRVSWPVSLIQWDEREAAAEDSDGHCIARPSLPHPIMVINLARLAGAPELLPSAFYDLSRCSPSDAAAGYMCPTSQLAFLSAEDLMKLLRGREHASRFLSTFIVNELEGRHPSALCAFGAREPGRRSCQAAFEAITFELLRNINVSSDDIRGADPLYAIYDLEAMLNRNFVTGGDHPTLYRACESCREEFRVLAEGVREDLWRHLPQWFDIDIANWSS
ncbi:hypothetical protein BDN71DRAFT_1426204 [Pleurotus eryngii]|uniref:BTB domain-containing protein n=1 Tax=Pleurotus eryngii TaxID=5323 RepID=A0A9P6AAW2_PLEER|nr:hypothetical protein BDN71DRAFT_1426204 [Pleurotus eryngii]